TSPSSAAHGGGQVSHAPQSAGHVPQPSPSPHVPSPHAAVTSSSSSSSCERSDGAGPHATRANKSGATHQRRGGSIAETYLPEARASFSDLCAPTCACPLVRARCG